MPGYRGGSDYNFEVLFGRTRAISHWNDEKVFNALMIFVFFFSAYLYRLSIKSTFWLYWPLAYIADDANGEERPPVLFDKLSTRSFAWFSALLAFITLVGFAATNFYADFVTLWPTLQVGFQVAAIEFLPQ
jgi:hypothetical protein